MFLRTGKTLIVGLIITFVILGGFLAYLQFQKEDTSQDVMKEEPQLREEIVSEQVPPSPTQEEATELIRTESVVCNDEIYIFDMVLLREKYSYFNDIYKTIRSPENFIVRLKAPTAGLDTFFLLAVPKKDCNRIYFTVVRYETSSPYKGIFEWRIGEKEVHELAVSKELFGHLAPSYPNDLIKDAVSPDGDKMIVAQLDERLTTDRWLCDPRVLKLLNLREDVSEILVRLPREETFTSNSTSGEEGFCNGLNFGWKDNTTVYYDVYDATVEGRRPLLERRTLNIE